MKKQLPYPVLFIFFAFLSGPFLLHGQGTRISIANGNWSNPSTWSPAGVPQPTDDTIIVNTDVTFSQNITHGNSLFRISAGASLTDANGNDTATFGGNRLEVDGYFSVGTLVAGLTDSGTVSGIVSVNNEMAQSGLFIVQPGGELCIGQQFATSDNFINNGSVKTNNWANGAVVTGNGGKFCVANSFINTDNISGAIDICDATPGTMYDINSGTISPSVTSCAAGPCAGCFQPNGIAEQHAAGIVSFYPNPVNASGTFKIDRSFIAAGLHTTLTLYNSTGAAVKQIAVEGETTGFERGTLASGLYFYTLTLNGSIVASGKLLIE